MFPIWDAHLFKIINEAHAPWIDQAMVIISGKLSWIPLYVFLVYLLHKKFKSKFWGAVLYLVSCVLFADQVSSTVFKPFFRRLRPCHVNEFQSWIHLPEGCGGLYGFCSSHSANAFAITLGFYLLTRNKLIGTFLIFWAILISYSRIYLGAHYPLDVIVGAVIGSLGATLLFLAYDKLIKNS